MADPVTILAGVGAAIFFASSSGGSGSSSSSSSSSNSSGSDTSTSGEEVSSSLPEEAEPVPFQIQGDQVLDRNFEQIGTVDPVTGKIDAPGRPDLDGKTIGPLGQVENEFGRPTRFEQDEMDRIVEDPTIDPTPPDPTDMG